MNKGKRWLKKMLKDRRNNLSRIMSDKVFFDAKIRDLGGAGKETVLRKELSIATKQQDENEKKKIPADAILTTRIKTLNDKINVIASMIDQYNACDQKIGEFNRYINSLKNILADPEKINKFNAVWR